MSGGLVMFGAGLVLVAVVVAKWDAISDAWERRRKRSADEPGCELFGPPLVRLEWANEVPVCVIEHGDPAEVAEWMEVAKTGPVLHV